MSEFDSLFMKHKADLGRCKLLEHFIDLEPDAIPHREGARRMTPDKASKANEEVRHLLALGMIQPSYSPWASGVVMVKKKDGEMRFCCDFRPLNDATIKDAYPLPRIDESLSRLGRTKCFTSIDLAAAFWQIPVKKSDRFKTAFACELGLFEWKRMPFGLCNATATFQRMMAKALRTVESREGSQVMCYIDDVIIATETVEDHLVRLREVFECLKKAGLKCKSAKCSFMKPQTKYLGRIITKDGVLPDPGAVEKVKSWQSPRNRTELASFFGFANYYREFVKDFATKAFAMSSLMRKATSFVWTDEAQKSFEDVKEALMNATALALPDSEGKFVLDTDASTVGISGILHQEQEWNGRKLLRPIYYGSHALNPTQMKYGAPKLEMLAVVTYVRKFHSYLAPRRFTLRVDNQALSWLKTYSMDLGMVGRWLMFLDQYDIEIEHRPRTQHTNADGLSKRTNLYVLREERLKKDPAIRSGFNFMDQEVYDAIPTAPHLDKHGKDTRPVDPPEVQVLCNPRRTNHEKAVKKVAVAERKEPGETGKGRDPGTSVKM